MKTIRLILAIILVPAIFITLLSCNDTTTSNATPTTSLLEDDKDSNSDIISTIYTEDEIDSLFKYELDYSKRACKILKYIGSLDNVTIPGTIKNCTVTIIGNGAFANSYFKSIIIPGSVSVIEQTAFDNCINLENITFSKGLISIEDAAFDNCTALLSIVLPDSVTSIGANAFLDCRSLKDVVIPDNVIEIGSNAFSGTAWLKNSKNFVVVGDGILIAYNGSDNNIVIPEGVKKIENAVCVYNDINENDTIKSVVFPDSVKVIDDYAFYNCTRLSYVLFSRSSQLDYIGSAAFFNCSLLSICIPDGVTHIGDSAFNDNGPLKDVTIPDTVTEIGSKAFEDTAWIKSITADPFLIVGDGILLAYNGNDSKVVIPDGVKVIGANIFDRSNWVGTEYVENETLESIVIPDSVIRIGDNAFNGCVKLEKIELPEKLEYIGYYAFCHCPMLTSIELPSGVSYIGMGAFKCCTGLKSITMNCKVAEINYETFISCTNLTEITLNNNLKMIYEGSFYRCDNLKTIHYLGSNIEYKEIKLSKYSLNDPMLKTLASCNITYTTYIDEESE